MMPLWEWLLRSLTLAALVSVAAWSCEVLLRGWRAPARWVWICALGFTMLLPLLSVVTPQLWPNVLRPDIEVGPSSLLSAVLTAASLQGAAVQTTSIAAESQVTISPRVLLIGFWLIVSLACALRWCHGWLRLHRARRSWRQVTLADRPVYVSERFGPAVVGLRRPRIVLPGWLLRGDAKRLRMVMRHETEHARAGDHWLLALAPLAAVCFPLNPALWWQLRRLRLAIEMDCDARVLRGGESALDYGTMLLDMAGGVPMQATLATLTEPRTFLERRIRFMSASRNRSSMLRVLALFTLAMASMFAAALAGAPSQAVVAQQPPPRPQQPAQAPRLLAPPVPGVPLLSRSGRRIERPHPSRLLPPQVPQPAPALQAPAPPSLRARPRRVSLPAPQVRSPGQPPQPAQSPIQAPQPAQSTQPPQIRQAPQGPQRPQTPQQRQRWLSGRVWNEQAQQEREPILVVDGLVLGQQNRFDAIVNRLRIASVEILNSTEAVKRFGAAGRNGAVLVTTAPREPDAATDSLRGALLVRQGASETIQPLIFIDGVLTPQNSDKKLLDDLAPEWIDSIEILKGNAAIAKYGERGRNGVIIITTKKR